MSYRMSHAYTLLEVCEYVTSDDMRAIGGPGLVAPDSDRNQGEVRRLSPRAYHRGVDDEDSRAAVEDRLQGTGGMQKKLKHPNTARPPTLFSVS